MHATADEVVRPAARRRLLQGLAGMAVLASWAPPGAAEDFPARPVRIIVPQTPGGASDALARTLGQRLGERWKQPVVIENRPGAGGNVGMELVAGSAPDGHTLLMSYVGSQAINGSLYRKLPFDPQKDFAPIATVATLPFVIVTRAGSAVTSVAELVAAAKTQRLTFGSAGNGSVNHLLGEMFNSATGVKLEHVPYRGAAPALQDLAGGQIDVVFTSLPSVAALIRGGKLTALAVTSARRAPGFDSIPTVAESGLPGFDVNPWFGLLGPARMPAAVVTRINADVNALLAETTVIESFRAQGAEPYVTSPPAFAAELAADIAKWGKVVRDAGAQLD